MEELPVPYININTNTAVSKEKEIAVKTRLGQAISLLPGKSESWLMVGFEPETSLYFRGDGQQRIAFVEVSVYGTINPSAADRLTAAITDILREELDIQQVYINYGEVGIWVFNGSNF